MFRARLKIERLHQRFRSLSPVKAPTCCKLKRRHMQLWGLIKNSYIAAYTSSEATSQTLGPRHPSTTSPPVVLTSTLLVTTVGSVSTAPHPAFPFNTPSTNLIFSR